MWYSGRSAASEVPESLDAVAPSSGSVGVAVSADGVNWTRSSKDQDSSGSEAESAADADAGVVMQPNADWWTFDTCHMTVSDVQVRAGALFKSILTEISSQRCCHTNCCCVYIPDALHRQQTILPMYHRHFSLLRYPKLSAPVELSLSSEAAFVTLSCLLACRCFPAGASAPAPVSTGCTTVAAISTPAPRPRVFPACLADSRWKVSSCGRAWR